MKELEPYGTQEGLSQRAMVRKCKAGSVGEFAAPYMGIDQRQYHGRIPSL